MSKYKYFLLILLFSLSACDDCGPGDLMPCGGSNTTPMIDLVVIIDSSGSMGPISVAISDAAESAVAKALTTCNSDLQIKYFGLTTQSPSPLFANSFLAYLQGIETAPVTYASLTGHTGLASEQGANAIEDLSNYYDWREDACKAIFYISDEELDSSTPRQDFANELAVTNSAILAAQNNEVAVFSHFISSLGLDPQIVDMYEMLSEETGGIHKASDLNEVSPEFYEDLIPEVICNSCSACTLNNFF